MPYVFFMLQGRRKIRPRILALGNHGAARIPVLKPMSFMWSRGSWTFPIWTALALLLGLLLLLSGPSLAQEPTSADLQPRTTVASNMREGPGLQHPVRRVLAAGTAVQVTAQNPDGSWLQL